MRFVLYRIYCNCMSICVCLCPSTDISATVRPIDVKFCMTVHIGPGHKVSPFGGGTPEDPKIHNFGPKLWPFNQHLGLTANMSITERNSVTCQLGLTAVQRDYSLLE